MRFISRAFFILILLLCPIIASAQDAESTETPEVDAAQVLADAEALVARAEVVQERNLDVANSIMGLIEVGGIFITFITAVGILIASAIGISNFRDLRRQITAVEEEIDSIEILKRDLTNQLVTVRAEITLLQQAKDDVMKTAEQLSMMNDLPELVDQRMADQRNHADNQLQALSLVPLALQQILIGNRHAALNTLIRASSLQAENAVINYFYGEVLVREHQYDRGITYLEKACQSSDMPDANATLAYAYRRLGDDNPERRDRYYSQSESIYLELREEHPDLLDITGESVYGGLAGIYRSRNMIDKAIRIYEDIAQITPNSSYPINNLGLLHFEYDDLPYASRDKGREYFEKARRKADVTLRLEGDYWRLFDIITAEIALEVTEWEDIKLRVDNVFDLDPTHNDILKLIEGIERLQKSIQPPKYGQQTIDYIHEHMK